MNCAATDQLGDIIYRQSSEVEYDLAVARTFYSEERRWITRIFCNLYLLISFNLNQFVQSTFIGFHLLALVLSRV